MKRWQITSSAGVELGPYVASSAAEALEAMARDAGYESQAEAAAVAGAFDGTVTELEASPAYLTPRRRAAKRTRGAS